jgi:SAM-dependent methyltransferase
MSMEHDRPRLISAATVTRLRNAFARVTLEVLTSPPAPSARVDAALPFSSMTADDWRRAVELWNAHAAEVLAVVAGRPCPACGSAGSREIFTSYDSHRFDECGECGCWFTPKHVDWSTFEAFFARSPEGAALARSMMGYRDEAAKRDSDMQRIGRYLDDLLPVLAREGSAVRYLDAGCGVGHSLRAGRLRGLDVQGVEVDTNAIALGRADGLPVAGAGEPIPPGPYHLLSFWETLEHIADPLGALTAYLPYLDEDGLVAITVPNLNALETRALRQACPWVHGGYNTPGHVNLFHPASMEALLSRAGLTLLDAQGEFSGNPENLFAVLLGHSGGAFDVLDPSRRRGSLPRSAVEVISEAWPGVALLEQLALASPILYVIACRKGRERHFEAALAARSRAYRESAAGLARDLISKEPDYQAIAEHLDREVKRQVEVMTSLQHEINRRDQLLEDERERYARSVNGRVLRLRQRLTGAARRLGWPQ